VWSLISKELIFIIPFQYIFAGICWSGINLSLLNLSFIYSPLKGKTVYLSVYNCMMGVIGLAATILGTIFVRVLDKTELKILTIPFSSMQILFAVSGLLMVGVGIFIKVNMEQNELFKKVESD